MSDTKFISNAGLERQAVTVEESLTQISAGTNLLDKTGNLTHPGWLPVPATTETADGDVGEKCHQRVLCECVMKELRAGDRIEHWVWIALSASGAVTILYAAYCFLFRS